MDVSVSPETSALLDEAATLSVRRGQRYVGVEHLFTVLADKPQLLPPSVIDRFGTALQTVARELERAPWPGTLPSVGPEVFYTPRCANAVNDAAKLAERMSRSHPTAAHLLLVLLADAHSSPSRCMDRLGFARDELLKTLRNALAARKTFGPRPTPTPKPEARERETVTAGPESQPKPKALDSVVRDLTRAARAGRIEPAVGREKETLQILQILARKSKNNAILVGEAGVGKTKIVEGLAVAAAQDGLGGLLSGYRILELDVGALMSGTMYRGAFEEKLHGLIEELKQSPKTILFIDEIHLIMGAGSTEGGSIDAANLLKPALARSEIRCLGATTLQEYRKFIERDPALERRFQMVRIEALSESATYELLMKLRPSLEEHHGIHIGRRALRAAVVLTQRYMPNRQLPDKAIDALDQACARYRLKAIARQANPALQFDSSDGEEPAQKVTPHDIRKVVSQMTGIPIEDITSEERMRLNNLERKLRERVVGQDDAAAKVAAAVKRSSAGLSDPNRPSAVMLFLGPSGVGKTQMAKELADRLFGSPDHLVSFDMSEYVEAHSVSKLIGAPPGYSGCDEEGRLAGAVRNKPFSVLLFDEIEKAHPRVFDVLLPVLDEGRLRDSRGRDISFRNCIIILTSNLGANLLERSDDEDMPRILEELRRHFRPEFINRIDEIVPFYPLLFEDVRAILHLLMAGLRLRLAEKHIGLHVYQGAYEYLAREGYSPEFGARELRRTVDRHVVNPIGELILSQRFVAGDIIGVLAENDTLTFRKEPQPEQKASVS